MTFMAKDLLSVKSKRLGKTAQPQNVDHAHSVVEARYALKSTSVALLTANWLTHC